MAKDIRQRPPLDGSVTFPECVDFHSIHNPTDPLFVFNHDDTRELTKVTFLEFARASDRAAHYIRPGRAGPEREVVALIALSDTLLYHAVSFGILRAGYIPYYISPRNPPAVILKLMSDVCCSRLLTTRETLHSVAGIEAKFSDSQPGKPLTICEMPPIYQIFPRLGHETAEDPFVPYPKAQNRPRLSEVMLYLHSSGSTGIPRTVPQTFEAFVNWAAFPYIQQVRNLKSHCTLGLMGLPAFHALGVLLQSLLPMYTLTPIALYPPTATSPTALPITPTPDNILEHMRRTNTNATVAVPTILQVWAQDKAALDYLATFDFIITGGAPMPPKLGSFLIKSGVPIWVLYGGTEFGTPTYLFEKPEGEDGWEYLKFDERMKIKWEPQGDGTYECQFLSSDCHHLSFENMGEERGYATSDLWVPHPTVPDYWKIVGRKDDVIIHASGEKTVPLPMENIIFSSPYVGGVIYFGREKGQPGVLIELKPEYSISPSNREQLIKARDLLWPTIEEANRIAPSFSKIFKELIIFTSPSKPLPRAGKGSVMRKAALAAYNEEIEAVYAEIESTVDTNSIRPPNSWGQQDIASWLMLQTGDVLADKAYKTSSDLIESGIDSLGVTILRRRIVAALQADNLQEIAKHLPYNMVYQNPSVDTLSEFLARIVSNPTDVAATANRVDELKTMIEIYSENLDVPCPVTHPPRSEHINVLITGTTGSLGAYLLAYSSSDPKIDRVYTLNRPFKSQSLLDRHRTRFQEAGLKDDSLVSDKVIHLEGDMHKKWLGLPEDVYQQLVGNVTHIIHNAWTVNFNLPLASFEPNIAGSRNLIDLGRSAQTLSGHSVKFTFTSSVSSMFGWDRSAGPCPEEVSDDAECCIGIGYGESKYVVERILKRSGLQATTIRLGQISGGEPIGAWSPNDWLPILVKSSITLKGLPSLPGVCSWVPIHTVTAAVLGITLSSEASSVYNLVHPRPMKWDTVMKHFNDVLVQERVLESPLPIIPYDEWISRLQKQASNATPEIIERLPAIKLIDFFTSIQPGQPTEEATGGPTFSTQKVQADSLAVSGLQPITMENVGMWLRYWKSGGTLL